MLSRLKHSPTNQGPRGQAGFQAGGGGARQLPLVGGAEVRCTPLSRFSPATEAIIVAASAPMCWIRTCTMLEVGCLVKLAVDDHGFLGEVVHCAFSNGEYTIGVEIEHALDARQLQRDLAEWFSGSRGPV
jgi:hypothetical protein